MVWKDEIVEEVRRYRDEYASKFNYDLEAMLKDLQEKERRHQEKLVSFLAHDPPLQQNPVPPPPRKDG